MMCSPKFDLAFSANLSFIFPRTTCDSLSSPPLSLPLIPLTFEFQLSNTLKFG